MLDGGIRAAGGTFETEPVPPAARWRDLTAFTRCVIAAARLLRNPPPAPTGTRPAGASP
jgi:hypothetical protein